MKRQLNFLLGLTAALGLAVSCRADEPVEAPIPAGYAWKTAFVKRGIVGNYKTEWAGGLNATTRLRVPMPFEGTQAKVYFKSSYNIDVDLARLSLAPGTDDNGTTTGKYYPIQFDGKPGMHLAAKAKDLVSDAAEVPVTKGTWYLQESYSSPEYAYAYDKDTFFFGKPDAEGETTLGKKGKGAWISNATRIDVLTKDTRPTILCFGDSITQGYNSTPNTSTRYPDVLGKLLNRPTLNLGQNGDLFLYARYGAPSMARQLKGVDTVVLVMGINDIISGQIKTVEQYAEVGVPLCESMKKSGFKFYMGTVTPAGGNTKFDADPEKEKLRLEINEWIRTKAKADGIIDFDKALADPANPGKLKAEYQSDWLHPSDAGYQKMAETAAAVIGK